MNLIKNKITRKEIMNLNSIPLSNIIYDEFYFKFCKNIYHNQDLSEISFIHKLGKPLITMPNLESNPGVWIMQDEISQIKFIIFSDLYKKYHFKGTSYEVIIDENYKREEFENVSERLFSFIYKLARK